MPTMTRRLGRGVISAGALLLAGACIAGVTRVPPTPTAHGAPETSTASSTSEDTRVDGCVALTFGLHRLTTNSQTLAQATGQLTRNARTIDGIQYVEMVLTNLRVIAGTPLHPTARVWLEAKPNPDPGNVPGLWSMDGSLIAIVTPQRVAQTPVGPTARVAPVLDNRVVLSAAGCWADTSLHAEPLTGESFQEVPGTTAQALAEKFGGFRTVSISALTHAAH